LSAHHAFSLSASLKSLAKALYAGLPLAGSQKKGLKNLVYSGLAPLIRHTDSYRYWLVSRREEVLRAGGQSSAVEYVARLPADFQVVFGQIGRRSAVYQPLRDRSLVPVETDAKVIAFYLPQYHPFPENDAWWGRGFTEWTNVAKAVPQFMGHGQPNLPGELGFYDLRVKAVQQRQVELARLYGVHGFCYHHYWFAGKRLMETPFNQVLADPSLDLPFCLCWANENWTRRWDGAEHDVLISQDHSPEDDLAFIADIASALNDSRYIRVEGRALLIVYRVALLPDPKATADRWRKYCRENGIGELHLIVAQTFGINDPRDYGFDGAVQFPPHNSVIADCSDEHAMFNPSFVGRIFRYADMVEDARKPVKAGYPQYRCAFPSWDNSARKGSHAHVFQGASPELFASWLRGNLDHARRTLPPTARLTFINAWNEWGEGAYLEPDSRHGYAYLEAVAGVLEEASAMPEAKSGARAESL
jgi:lipopolysaccharide biosynthesis protein